MSSWTNKIVEEKNYNQNKNLTSKRNWSVVMCWIFVEKGHLCISFGQQAAPPPLKYFSTRNSDDYYGNDDCTYFIFFLTAMLF